ncbi:MAG: succinate dehydrogenase assembly factor 2 [Casimicrobiaceae bacterium]
MRDSGADALANTCADPVYLSRLRWRCRRGMLENDLVLARFLDARGTSLDATFVAALTRALDLPDGELWDLIARRTETDDPVLRPVVDALRDA